MGEKVETFDHHLARTGKYYMTQAARIRAIAETVKEPEIRTELLKVAIAFERLAKRIPTRPG